MEYKLIYTYAMADGKSMTQSINGIKPDMLDADARAIGTAIARDQLIEKDGVKVQSVKSIKLVGIQEREIAIA